MPRRRIIHRRGPHKASCRHCPRVRALGREFQGWRAAWEARMEHETIGYATEEALYRAEHPAPTFKAYLIAMRGAGWPMSNGYGYALEEVA